MVAMQEQLSQRNLLTAASPEQRELMEAQNSLLLQQVQSMSRMMSEQSFRMQQYMSAFPLPSDEANRVQMIKKKGLLELERPIAPIDDLLRSCVVTDLFGKECVAIFLHCLVGDNVAVLAATYKDREANEWLDSAATGIANLKGWSRKMST